MEARSAISMVWKLNCVRVRRCHLLYKVVLFLMNINKSEHLKLSKLLVDSILRPPEVPRYIRDLPSFQVIFFIVDMCAAS